MSCSYFFAWFITFRLNFKVYTIFPHIVSAEIIRFWIWKSKGHTQYIRPKVSVNRCAETIQGRKLYEEDCTFVSLSIPLNKLSCLFQLQSAEKLDEPLERLLVTIDPKEVDFKKVGWFQKDFLLFLNIQKKPAKKPLISIIKCLFYSSSRLG